ncbi:MAG: PDZ domain-containing protein [Candidatus Rokuibacteriota bacterium]
MTEALARSANLPRIEGVYVRRVESGSPGARAGIQTGDVLLLAAGTYLSTSDALSRVLAGAPLGSSAELALRRGGELLTARLPVESSPAGRLMAVIRLPAPGLLHLAADGAALWAYGPVPGGTDRGIIPVPLPGGPPVAFPPRAVASSGAERVIAADGERVYLGWAGSELYIDVYELGSGRVSRLAVRGAESLANRCRPQGLTRVGPELWLACQRTEGPAVARIDLASGQTRIDPLPPTYVAGLAFDGEAVLWLCCADASGRASLSRTELASGATRVFPLPRPVTSLAADLRAVYLLGPGGILQHAPWR